ncbi:SDR family NAD(P)-dependent oxidoreductase [Flavobacterium sp. Root420]|uniref:SDR family NAD(P)-dependent oxidoreductase n=1 Tax=Flavobacterium sp. Root420 TaxID=1736533 RepID=UPI000A889981|nr:SDR family NAD(P)-dependent oxidoreductase [Flavobacterium sp. Root420]
MNLANNKILITGGASGIGLGLTERFIQENNTVIICGRREAVLNEVKAKFPTVITKVCDLSYEKERIALYEWIAENHPDLNVLINNAGIQKWVSVTDADFYQSMKTELNTNIEAPLHLTSFIHSVKIAYNSNECNLRIGFFAFCKSSCLFGYKSFFPFVYPLTSSYFKSKKY